VPTACERPDALSLARQWPQAAVTNGKPLPYDSFILVLPVGARPNERETPPAATLGESGSQALDEVSGQIAGDVNVTSATNRYTASRSGLAMDMRVKGEGWTAHAVGAGAPQDDGRDLHRPCRRGERIRRV
jgi:hypothetical protein